MTKKTYPLNEPMKAYSGRLQIIKDRCASSDDDGSLASFWSATDTSWVFKVCELGPGGNIIRTLEFFDEYEQAKMFLARIQCEP